MKKQTNNPARLSWDRRPLTARDMGIVLALLVLVCLTGMLLTVFALQGGAGAALAGSSENNQTQVGATVSETQEVGSNGQIVSYTLRTLMGGDPVMAFVGVGGDIDGIANPELTANVGDTVRITIINGDPTLHDLTVDELDVYSGQLTKAEESITIEFVATQPGVFNYYCSVPGHRASGMEGILRIEGESGATAELATQPAQNNPSRPKAAPAAADAVSVIRHPADLPPPLAGNAPQHHVVELTAVEIDGVLDDGTTFRYMTFNGQVPAPMLRMRVGDTMEIRVHNEIESMLQHSIDLHAVTGPHGGAELTQTLSGETSAFQFKALKPGLYVYHCATPSVVHHISSGMYGMILVEPEGGLPPVDHEFYIMQGEIYTEQPFGTDGHLDFSHEKMLDEDPEYYIFNGAAGALTLDEYAMRAEVGDTIRIYFGVGGPNKISSLHLIGEIFDNVYDQASLTSPPLTGVQTTLVPPGGATVVELTLETPGNFVLVDHALSRVERGLAAYLYVEGDPNPDIFGPAGSPDN